MIKVEKKEIIEAVRRYFYKFDVETVDLQMAYIDKCMKYNNEIEYDLYYYKFGENEVFIVDSHRNIYYFEFYKKTGIVWEIEGTNNYADVHSIKLKIKKKIDEYIRMNKGEGQNDEK